MHDTARIEEGPKKKPEIILYHNTTKGGVDSMDKMAKTFTCKRKSKRWPMAIFSNMIDLTTVAGRVIWQVKYSDHALSHADARMAFIQTMARSLMVTHLQKRQHITSLSLPLSRLSFLH
ncbi:PiggyBac transposable element-derived protein 4 [Plakobranchus ocellatus]|uniref:PiggyBac transposable element-derived protein 4 n=1 Tax=Plakobranchus ocellatus TaxID=259542 RepID=A0AAV4AVP4_9GAST|nr:PiggyBac transposable element-derived protein 4 [Plakobranchus ocellatus]